MPVNPWGGVYAGLASLDRTFEDLSERRRQREFDKYRLPLLKAQVEMSDLSLEEKQRRMTRLRDYEAASAGLESGFDTARVKETETVPNPAFTPNVPGSPLIYRPEIERTTERPLTEIEKTRQRVQLAMKHGQYDVLNGIASSVDITNKIGETARITKFLAAMDKARTALGMSAAKQLAPRFAKEMGIDPRLVQDLDFNRDGLMYIPTRDGGVIYAFPTPDGKWHVQQVKPETGHNTIEVKSPDGTKARRMQWNPATRAYDIAATGWYKVTGGTSNIVTTPTPGILLDKSNLQYFRVGADGQRVALTSEQVVRDALKFKEDLPADTIRVMQQSAPKVLTLLRGARASLKKVRKTGAGPLASRWREAWTGGVGATDPDFMKLRTHIGLLKTMLMRMHVGARGGVQLMDHFTDLINASKQSPENMDAALDVIEFYAQDVAKSRFGAESSSPPPTSDNNVQTILDKINKGEM